MYRLQQHDFVINYTVIAFTVKDSCREMSVLQSLKKFRFNTFKIS